MPLGIRPINDFAFKKTFGTPENRPCLISLLNAILRLLADHRHSLAGGDRGPPCLSPDRQGLRAGP
jgi:hypothetical protein